MSSPISSDGAESIKSVIHLCMSYPIPLMGQFVNPLIHFCMSSPIPLMGLNCRLIKLLILSWFSNGAELSTDKFVDSIVPWAFPWSNCQPMKSLIHLCYELSLSSDEAELSTHKVINSCLYDLSRFSNGAQLSIHNVIDSSLRWAPIPVMGPNCQFIKSSIHVCYELKVSNTRGIIRSIFFLCVNQSFSWCSLSRVGSFLVPGYNFYLMILLEPWTQGKKPLLVLAGITQKIQFPTFSFLLKEPSHCLSRWSPIAIFGCVMLKPFCQSLGYVSSASALPGRVSEN
jgi:hypothetical protein